MSEVKEVFKRLLEDAPPMSQSAEHMVRTARGAHNRRRGLLASGAAALAVVAVVATASAILAQQPADVGPLEVGQPGQSTTPSAPPPATAPAMPALPPAPLRFAPTWLPQGWAEHGRMTWFGEDTGGPSNRLWAKAPPQIAQGELKGTRFELSSRKDTVNDPGASGSVDINGHHGLITRESGRPKSITWRVGDVVLNLQQWGATLTEQEMLQIARSVQPDAGKFTVPFTLGRVPAGYAPSGVEFVGRSPSSWHAALRLSGSVQATEGPASKPGPPPMLTVALGTETLAPQGGEALTVGGHPARYVVAKVAGGTIDLPYVVVDLGGGLLLTISALDTPREQLVQVAEGVTHDPAADLSWIGRS